MYIYYSQSQIAKMIVTSLKVSAGQDMMMAGEKIFKVHF